MQASPALIFLASTPDLAFDAFELNATDYLIFPCSTERFERTLMRLQQFQTHFRLAPPPGSHWKEQYIPKRELPSHSIPLATSSTGDVLPSVHAAIQNHNFSQIDSQTIQADSQLFLEASKQASTATPIDVPPIQQGETVTIAIGEQEQEHLASALKKAWKNTTADIPPTDLDKLAIPFEGKTRFIPYVDIAFIEAFEDYSYVHTAEERYLTNYRLKNVEARLRLHRFFRVHRKYLVNLDMVTELATVSGNHCVLRTAGRTRIELPISRRRLSDLKQALGM